jgi:hypothetical protein
MKLRYFLLRKKDLINMSTLKINHIITFLLLLVTFVFAGEPDSIGCRAKSPKFELEADAGLFWLAQVKFGFNFNDRFFGKIRYSESLASEYGFSAGYQKTYSSKTKLQIGIGYSRGKFDPFVPGGPNADDTTEYLNGGVMEYDFIQYFNRGIIRIGFNVSVNFIFYGKRAIPSFNTGLIIGMF